MSEFHDMVHLSGWFTSAGDRAEVALASRARLSRNLSGYPFPHKMDREQERQASEEIRNAIARVAGDEGLSIKQIGELNETERKMMIERRFLNRRFSLQKEKFFAADQQNRRSFSIHDRDHLELCVFDGGISLRDVYAEAERSEKLLEDDLDFAVSLERGYLTSQLKNCGTGLKMSVLLQMPALERSSILEHVFKSVMNQGFSIKGFSGSEEQSLGNLYQLYNSVGIGMSEKEIVEKLEKLTLQLVQYELRKRDEMAKKMRVELEDLVYRAYGLIHGARLIGEREAVSLLADLRLGTALGWLSIPIERLNMLLITVRDGHIESLVQDKQEDHAQQIKRVRAQFIKYALGIGAT
jgi:protein arginine kinase